MITKLLTRTSYPPNGHSTSFSIVNSLSLKRLFVVVIRNGDGVFFERETVCYPTRKLATEAMKKMEPDYKEMAFSVETLETVLQAFRSQIR